MGRDLKVWFGSDIDGDRHMIADPSEGMLRSGRSP
jgi:hypothetical protein